MKLCITKSVKQHLNLLFLLVFTAVIPNQALALKPTDRVKVYVDPNYYSQTGVVVSVNRGARSITISGQTFYYGIDIKVKNTNSNTASISDLKNGSEIGFNYDTNDKKKRFLRQIWILPKGVHVPG